MSQDTVSILGRFIELLARLLDRCASVLSALSRLLYGLVPVLLTPEQLTRGVRDYYREVYRQELAPPTLLVESWENDGVEGRLLDCHGIRCGRVLVLATGWGHESVALAQRGFSVVAMDANPLAVRTAHGLARTGGVRAYFHQACFLELPYRAASFNAVLLPSAMYSAIPGSSLRRTWLSRIGHLLKPQGIVMLSFLSERRPVPRSKRLSTRISLMLTGLPGANRTYQPGDDCGGGHFLHSFQDEAELRWELVGAGAGSLTSGAC